MVKNGKHSMPKSSIHIILFTGILLLQVLCAAASAESANEDIVKAAMVRNFARFTEWPDDESTTSSPQDDITFCIMGDKSIEKPFGGLAGKKIGARNIAILQVNGIADIQGCDILFVDKTALIDIARIMAVVDIRPVLTVGETKSFTQAGGIITFFIREGKIRFQINLEAAEKAGLKISSRLSKMAVIVNHASGGE